MATVRPPRLASLNTVFIKKVVGTPKGDIEPGFGTGFLYRDTSDQIWLGTNWHGLTVRRPDDPGFLLSGYPHSPYKIRVTFALRQLGAFSVPIEYPLYEEGAPTWIEFKRARGFDLAALPITVPDFAAGIVIQNFAEVDNKALEPGLDVIVVGYPFEH